MALSWYTVYMINKSERQYESDIQAAGDQIRIEGLVSGSAKYVEVCDEYNVSTEDVESYILDSECTYAKWFDGV
jgi:hypothetical protein